MNVDSIHLNFSPTSLMILNVVLGLVMFGVALDLKIDDFRRVLRNPKPALIGLFAQFVILPAATCALVWLIHPWPSIGLGMILVASCPGGNISNFVTHFARGNTALSVSMSAISTMAAIFMTPFNISFWGNVLPSTRGVMKQVALDPMSMLLTIVMLLGVPLTLGMLTAYKKPKLAARMRQPMKIFSLIFFGMFIVGALAANWKYFVEVVGVIIFVVIAHNTTALACGYFAARAAGLAEADRRAVAIEVGIQNSGLGLILVFNFFNGLGGMAIIAAMWGVWHVIAGLALATFWRRRIPQPVENA